MICGKPRYIEEISTRISARKRAEKKLEKQGYSLQMERKLHISIRKAKIITRACGVVGSASALQAEGHRFDSGLVHSFCCHFANSIEILVMNSFYSTNYVLNA